MSVPVGKRGENTLEVWQEAVKLCKYTMEITANKKNFPGRYAPMVNRINDCAVGIAENLWKANKTYVGEGCDPRNIKDRLYLQNRAIEQCNTMLFLIDLAHKVLHRDTTKTMYWGEMARKTKQLAVKWRESDYSRLTQG